MNYEELLEARNDSRQKKQWLPIGDFYRLQIEGKWRCVVDVRPEMYENLVFAKAMDEECKKNGTISNRHQIHFEAVREQGTVRQLNMELGNYITYDQLLLDYPAVVAQKDFLDNILESLVDITTTLHQQGIYHVCFSPRNVFVRKGDDKLMLASHGSFYFALKDQRAFYGDDADYVAPEVLDHGTIDERCDVYSIGRFLQSLCDQSDIPLEFRKAIKKAVSPSPEDRFPTTQAMLAYVRSRRRSLSSLKTFLIAAAIAALCVGIYFEMLPESSPVEFVKPAPRQPTDDLLDDGFSPDEFGVASDGDSLVPDQASERDYQAKAEEIFRKRYEKEADRILSRIYNNTNMSNSEKKFMSENETTIDELMKSQSKLGEEAGLTPERSQLIASQIIDRITNQKKKSMSAKNK